MEQVVLTGADRVGPVVSAKGTLSVPPAGTVVVPALGTANHGFEAIKHLVSDKPLHRRGDRRDERR